MTRVYRFIYEILEQNASRIGNMYHIKDDFVFYGRGGDPIVFQINSAFL